MSNNDYNIQREMLDYIKSHKIYYIADLWVYAEKERAYNWFVVLRNRKTYKFMKFYLSELRGATRRAKKKVPPPKHSWYDELVVIKEV